MFRLLLYQDPALDRARQPRLYPAKCPPLTRRLELLKRIQPEYWLCTVYRSTVSGLRCNMRNGDVGFGMCRDGIGDRDAAVGICDVMAGLVRRDVDAWLNWELV